MKTCKDINITIRFFEEMYESGRKESYYQIEYTPLKKDFFINDALRQGGLIADTAFKTTNRKDFNEVFSEIKQLFTKAKAEDIHVRILYGSHEYNEAYELRSIQNGIIFYNGKFLAKNRQLNEQEYDLLFRNLMIFVSTI